MSYVYANATYTDPIYCAAASIYDAYTASGDQTDKEGLELLMGDLALIRSEEDLETPLGAQISKVMWDQMDWKLPENITDDEIQRSFRRVGLDLCTIVGDATSRTILRKL